MQAEALWNLRWINIGFIPSGKGLQTALDAWLVVINRRGPEGAERRGGPTELDAGDLPSDMVCQPTDIRRQLSRLGTNVAPFCGRSLLIRHGLGGKSAVVLELKQPGVPQARRNEHGRETSRRVLQTLHRHFGPLRPCRVDRIGSPSRREARVKTDTGCLIPVE
jgi:hypothetical protein